MSLSTSLRIDLDAIEVRGVLLAKVANEGSGAEEAEVLQLRYRRKVIGGCFLQLLHRRLSV